MDRNSAWKRSRHCIRIVKITNERNKQEAEKSCRVMMKMIVKMKRRGNFLKSIGKNADFYIRF